MILIIFLQLYSLLFSAGAPELMNTINVSQIHKAFAAGIQAIMKYGHGQQGDRTMVSICLGMRVFLEDKGMITMVKSLAEIQSTASVCCGSLLQLNMNKSVPMN